MDTHVFVLGVSSLRPWDNPPSLLQNRAQVSRVARTWGHQSRWCISAAGWGPECLSFPVINRREARSRILLRHA